MGRKSNNPEGRPPKPESERKTAEVKFLLTQEEKEILMAAAGLHGYTISEYARLILDEAYSLVNDGPEAAISTMCASAEDKARSLDVDVEIKPVFKTYKVVEP